MEDKLLTAGEVAEKLGVTQRAVRNWAVAGIIPCIRITEITLRFSWPDVLAALKQKEEKRPIECANT